MKEFFETQTRDKSDQKSAIQKNFVILTMVIMNTKEATADFWLYFTPSAMSDSADSLRVEDLCLSV